MENSRPLTEVPQEMLSLGQYALAMQGVQFFEYKLAILCTWAEIDLTPRTPPKNLEKALRPLLRNIAHAFQKASASELRNRLRDKIDPNLIADASAMIGWRDRLAHRYLREQYVLPPPIFGHRMFNEMQALTAEIEQLNARLDAETERIVASKAGENRESTRQLEDLAKQLMYGDI